MLGGQRGSAEQQVWRDCIDNTALRHLPEYFGTLLWISQCLDNELHGLWGR